MPIYEYECQHCHEVCEFIEKMDDEPKTECPRCGTDSLNRRIAAGSFILKGKGWYKPGHQ